ncbi:hypothetical protein PoB_003916400 [Plakobranchus ocellatus]|uniref:Uncharacterized protein n=1 Tax=Plakobranchus ocellatus TaxID=259542 RepID=A0AAV4B2R5_9GAST|nr:hypothetical protein PoB_003916400 [Plakobranchus ocellatus]
MAGYKRSLLKAIRKRQPQLFGHINRADGIEKQILCGKICGTKSRGRQRIKYTDSLNRIAKRKESPNNEPIRRTDNREEWKAMIADVCNRPGTRGRRRSLLNHLLNDLVRLSFGVKSFHTSSTRKVTI